LGICRNTGGVCSLACILADVLPVTATQDFFGGSVVEAMYCNVVPFFAQAIGLSRTYSGGACTTHFSMKKEDFVAKLQRRIMDVKYLRVMNTRQYVERYDWSNSISAYDQAFDAM
jgi:hypothetical protein